MRKIIVVTMRTLAAIILLLAFLAFNPNYQSASRAFAVVILVVLALILLFIAGQTEKNEL